MFFGLEITDLFDTAGVSEFDLFPCTAKIKKVTSELCEDNVCKGWTIPAFIVRKVYQTPPFLLRTGYIMFSKIVHPLELSESLTDIKLRISFAVKLGAKDLTLVHVLNPGFGGKGNAESRLRQFQEVFQELGVNVDYQAEEGHTASEISRIARELNSDLIYIPAKGRNFLLTSLLGSVTQDVIRLADNPVWVHKQRPFLQRKESMHKAIFATDFKEAAERSYPAVRALKGLIPELIILHVGERAADPYAEQIRRESVQERLGEVAEKFEPYFSRIRQSARIGSPASHILSAAEEHKADLIVLGRLNEPFPLHILGSTCARVTARAKSSILLIP